MTMQYTQINQQSCNYNGFSFTVLGDGTATSVKVNLSQAPFAISFGGMPPNGVDLQVGDEEVTGTATLSTDGSGNILLQIDFSSPPPIKSNVSSGTLGVSGSFRYNSL